MICPHCHNTIREEQRYLMSADPNAEMPSWVPHVARLLVLFVLLTVVFYLARRGMA